MNTSRGFAFNFALTFTLSAAALMVAALGGCREAQEEKVLDIEAPGVDIEINKDDDQGVDVRIETEGETDTEGETQVE